MPHGRFTKATTQATAALLAGSLVGPTLICLTGALAVAPFAAGGIAFHATKKGITSGKAAYKDHKARKEAAREAARDGTLTPVEEGPVEITPEMLVEYEACVRKIAAAATGVAIQGSLAAVMPHLSVVVVVNSVDLVSAIKQLRRLRKQDVHRAVSGMSKTEHVVIGVVLKMLGTGLTLGHADLCAMDTFVHDHLVGGGLSEHAFGQKVEAIFGGHDSVGFHVEAATAGAVDSGISVPDSPPPIEHSAVQMHQDILQHHVAHEINAAANFAPDEIERYLGLGDEWRPAEFAGTDQHSGLANVAIVGTVAAGMDVVITKVLEEPVHAAIDKVGLLRHENREAKEMDRVAVAIERDLACKGGPIKRKAVGSAKEKKHMCVDAKCR